VAQQAGGLDIINLQEVGCQEDEILVERITEWLCKDLDKCHSYTIDMAKIATGAQGLKVATIYNSKSLCKTGVTKHLTQIKKDKENQYGFIQHFKMNSDSSEEFLNINVHLNGGKTDGDKEIRTA